MGLGLTWLGGYRGREESLRHLIWEGAISMAALDTSFDGLPGLGGVITAVELVDGDENPNRVIGDKDSFFVTVDWNLSPPDQAALLDGTWTVNLYASSLGPGPEKKIGTATVDATGALSYTATIKVPYPYGGLAEDETPPPDSGVYQSVLVITYRTAAGRQTEMAGFAKAPTFMLRNP
jgi:hypothetical protein